MSVSQRPSGSRYTSSGTNRTINATAATTANSRPGGTSGRKNSSHTKAMLAITIHMNMKRITAAV